MGMDYYYLCPFCSHLEQGAGIPFHECEKISYNRYRVQYRINTTMELMGGRVPVDTYHMYNNATEYEGETVMLAPASGFYSEKGYGSNEVRIAYVLDKAQLKRAIFVLGKALEQYPYRTNK